MTKGTAVFLIGFGGPERQEDVRPFIENVVRGRNVPKERIDLVVNQYATIGGRSPYVELTEMQMAALQKKLMAEETGLPIFLGMLFSRPSIETALKDMADQGITKAVGVVLAPHRSEASFDKYKHAVEDTKKLIGASAKLPDFEYLDPWHAHPLFIEAIADRLQTELDKIEAQQLPRTRLIFTAHSIPKEMSNQCHYAQQIEQTAQLAFQAVKDRGRADGVDWVLGYQSRSGPPQQKWLEPDVVSRLEDARKAGKTDVVVAPVGFLVDHVEVLYDLDVLAKEAARQCGVNMLRAATVGTHPKFIELLAVLIDAKIESFYARS